MTKSLRTASLSSVALLLALAAAPAMGQETEPTTAPAEKGVSADAKAVLDRFSEATKKLGAFRAAGMISTDVVAAGQGKHFKKGFVSSFSSPSLFRHEIAKEIVIGGTGEKVYGYRPDKRVFLQEKAAASYARADDLPGFVAEMLDVQDPVLLSRLTEVPAEALVHAAASVTSDSGTLTAKYESGETRTIEFDGSSGLPKKVTIDFAGVLKKNGTPDVQAAQTVIEYARIAQEESPARETFAWAPPDGATDAAKAPDGAAGGAETSALVGKPAPAVKLKDLDGKDVALSDLKGSVVLIDFWATWCPPCREGLPYIGKIHAEFAPKGVKVYGVNEQEEAPTVKAFLEKTKLVLPVILDAEGKAGNAYGVTGIPTTILIGKDGLVKKVAVGFDPAEVEAFRKEISAALEK